MALVTTEIQLTESFQPYEKPPAALLWNTAVPRGLRMFNAFEAVVAAKPLNDDQSLLITTDLISRSFAYILAHFYASLEQDTAFDWNNRGQLRVRNAMPTATGSTLQQYAMALEDVVVPGDHTESWIARPLSILPPSSPSGFPMWNSVLSGEMHVSMQFTNGNDAASAVGSLSAGIWLWEFELIQAQRYGLNYAIPVQGR